MYQGEFPVTYHSYTNHSFRPMVPPNYIDGSPVKSSEPTLPAVDVDESDERVDNREQPINFEWTEHHDQHCPRGLEIQHSLGSKEYPSSLPAASPAAAVRLLTDRFDEGLRMSLRTRYVLPRLHTRIIQHSTPRLVLLTTTSSHCVQFSLLTQQAD